MSKTKPAASTPAAGKRLRVALLIETSNAYGRGLLEGIAAFALQNRSWSISLPEQSRGADPPDWIRRWNGDGIIARIETEVIARAVKKAALPTIDVSAARLLPDLPFVETDDAAIATHAAEHLLERGFRVLAYCGDERFNWSRYREQQFVRHVRAAGAEVHVHHTVDPMNTTRTWSRQRQQLLRWITQLPKPVGIMACYDIQAQRVLDACRDLNIAVPEEVAVIGVDNDPLLCELCDPPLSSVIPNTHRAGFLAAQLLDEWMAGQREAQVASNRRSHSIRSSGPLHPIEPVAHLIPPSGVRTRQSSDILAIDDPMVAQAMRHIRERACCGLSVSQLLQAVPLSRRALEGRFQRLLGRSPHAEIIRVRLDQVRHLLTETDLSIGSIARRTGFPHEEYLSVVFRRETGTTPSDFRRQNRPSV